MLTCTRITREMYHFHAGSLLTNFFHMPGVQNCDWPQFLQCNSLFGCIEQPEHIACYSIIRVAMKLENNSTSCSRSRKILQLQIHFELFIQNVITHIQLLSMQ